MPIEDTGSYQKLIRDLDSYLQHEIDEWNNIAKTTDDKIDTTTYHALLDIKNALNRLKHKYLS